MSLDHQTLANIQRIKEGILSALSLVLNKDVLNLDLTKISYDSFEYDQDDHFLDFLNKRPSKWEFIFQQLYPEDSNRRTRLYSQVINPKTSKNFGLKHNITKKLKNISRKRSRMSNYPRNSRSYNSSRRGESTNQISIINSSISSNKYISLSSIRSKDYVKDIRCKFSHGSLVKIHTTVLNKDDMKVERTIKLEETDDSSIGTPTPIIHLSKAKTMIESNKF